jgi:transposase
MSPATVVDLTRRAAEVVQSEYDSILNKIRCAPIMIQGHNCMRWMEPYARFTKRLQRCWAHILRESKDLAERFEEAIPCIKRSRGFMNR